MFAAAVARSASRSRAYLDYYLTRPDLVFDQAEALAALRSLGGRDGTAHARSYEGQWAHYIANTPSKPPASYLTDVCGSRRRSARWSR